MPNPGPLLPWLMQVRLMAVRDVFEPWLACSAVPQRLLSLTPGLALAEFADGSVRLLDSGSAATRVALAPQLSTAGLVAAACSLAAGQAYALLTDGRVHVWDLHLSRPPTFAVCAKVPTAQHLHHSCGSLQSHLRMRQMHALLADGWLHMWDLHLSHRRHSRCAPGLLQLPAPAQHLPRWPVAL